MNLFCITCILELLEDADEWGRPAVTVTNGHAYCYKHALKACGYSEDTP